MMFRSRITPAGRRAAVFAIAALTAAAAGQPQPGPAPDPLSGPKVREREVPGVEGRFGGEPAGPRARRAMPARAFQDALDALRGDDVAQDLRLTAEQDERISALLADYRAKMQAYMQEHRDELRGIVGEGARRALREGRRPRQEGGAEEGAMQEGPAASPEARERIAELRRNAPKFDDWQVKIWAELSGPQRRVVEQRMEEARHRVEERQGREYVQRRLRERQRQGNPAEAAPMPGGPADEAGQGRRGMDRRGPGAEGQERPRLRRIVERLEQLPPEERERILRRLEEELERRVRERQGGEAPPPAPRPRDPL